MSNTEPKYVVALLFERVTFDGGGAVQLAVGVSHRERIDASLLTVDAHGETGLQDEVVVRFTSPPPVQTPREVVVHAFAILDDATGVRVGGHELPPRRVRSGATLALRSDPVHGGFELDVEGSP